MFCNYCGAQVASGANNCSNCGASVGMNNNMNNQGMNQSMMNNNMMNQPMMNNNMMTNKGNNKNSIVILLTVAICLVVAVGTFVILSGKDEDKKDNDVVVVNTKNVDYNGFQYSIPTDYTSYIDNNKLYIEKQNDWEILFSVGTGYYEQGNATLISENFKRNGLQVLNYSKKTYSGIEFMVFEVSYNNEIGIMAYAKASSNQIYAIAAVNNDNTASHKALEALAPILKSAKQPSYTTSMKIDSAFSDINVNEYFVTE